jgi:hypothetical protein
MIARSHENHAGVWTLNVALYQPKCKLERACKGAKKAKFGENWSKRIN